MTLSKEFSISWMAAILPSVSLAGIPLYVDADVLKCVLSGYLVDEKNSLYQFNDSPELRLKFHGLDENGNGGYSFVLSDASVINALKKFTPALSIMIKGGRVHAIKVYDFSFPGELAQNFIYKGVLPNGTGLGSLVSDLLPFTSLVFDSAEEWLYTDQNYGGLEVTGWGVPLEDHPDQVITALCVISGAIS
ncbi:hypothetical protein SAMN05216593_1392 [Pseudomonas asturiensis]|uniref:Uncharacterized protein n=1 Tax=Pseudomonas asturiensis TaxID=1190415 RepID=A0A1M7QLI3_9PSED|nr:hypothetical protein SAMN05216593_1392 [Pseudomonas asturiensis]